MESIKNDFIMAISNNHLNHLVNQLSNHKILQIFYYLHPLLPLFQNYNNDNELLSLLDYHLYNTNNNNINNEEGRLSNMIEEFISNLFENYLVQSSLEKGIEIEIFSIKWRITKELSNEKNRYQISRDFPHQLPFSNHIKNKNNLKDDKNLLLLTFRFQTTDHLR